MVARAYWRGALRLSLVSVPVRLYAAVEDRSTPLHLIHKPTGERIRYEKVVPDHGPVAPEEIVKAFEYEKGRYLTLEPAELERLKVESKHTIDIVQFIDRTDLDPVYFERPYYLVPDGDWAEEAYLVIRDALRQSGKIALGQITLTGKEHIAAIRPVDRGMMLETLRYADEVRAAAGFFEGLRERPPDQDQLDLAGVLITRKSAPFDPSKFRDHYQAALKDLISAKLEQRPPELEEPQRPVKAFNLMEALKRSIAEAEAANPSPTRDEQRQPA